MLPRLAVALGPILLAAARGDPRRRSARRAPGDACRRSRARPSASSSPPRLPASRSVGRPDHGLDEARGAGALVFHAGTARDADGGRSTAGGRVLTGRRSRRDLAAAAAAGAERAADAIHAPASSAATTSARDGCRGARHAVPAGAPPMIPRYTLPEMGAIWSDAARFEAMLRVELAVARAQSARGQIPPEALAALETRARVDVARIAEIERTTDHDVIAFVSQVAEIGRRRRAAISTSG